MTTRANTRQEKTKNIFLICFLLFLFSCNSENEFYYGTWKSKTQDVTIELNKDSTITWKVSDIYFFENNPFKVVDKSSKQIKINVSTEFPLEIDFESCSNKNEQCLITSYKSYINKNMIDEVILANKNGQVQHIKRPEIQTIQLPDSLNGEFYIIYKEKKNQDSKIEINTNGIGYSLGKPDKLQLFNANRKFYFKNSSSNISIVNPDNYNHVNDSCRVNNGIVVIQHGFNQSGRDMWNKENKMKIDENFNIEYFELIRKNAR